jgi:hypothetical protein
MAASASSQFGLVLLFSIGTLLLLTMAPQFGTGKLLRLHCIINLILINSKIEQPWNAIRLSQRKNMTDHLQCTALTPPIIVPHSFANELASVFII